MRLQNLVLLALIMLAAQTGTCEADGRPALTAAGIQTGLRVYARPVAAGYSLGRSRVSVSPVPQPANRWNLRSWVMAGPQPEPPRAIPSGGTLRGSPRRNVQLFVPSRRR